MKCSIPACCEAAVMNPHGNDLLCYVHLTEYLERIRSCRACKFCFCETGEDVVCGHPKSYAVTGFGLSVNSCRQTSGPCGPHGKLFEPKSDVVADDRPAAGEPFEETALNRGGFDGARAKFVIDVVRNNIEIVAKYLDEYRRSKR